MMLMTEEHKRKIAEGRRRYFENNPWAREEAREHVLKMIAEGKMGFVRGNTIRKGIDPWNKGKTAKEDPRIMKHANIIDKKTGRARNYKGGRKYFTHKERLKIAAELRQWRRLIFERDNYTCQICGLRSGNGKRVTLNADHIKSFAHYPELRLDLNNGRTLCIDCHRKTDNFGGRSGWKNIKTHSKEVLDAL